MSISQRNNLGEVYHQVADAYHSEFICKFKNIEQSLKMGFCVDDIADVQNLDDLVADDFLDIPRAI